MPMVQNVVFPVTVPNSLRFQFLSSSFHVLEKQNIMLSGVCRIKSRDNRDKRVKYMEYAVQVETYTLSKAKNLVLNVDGAIGSLFLDLLVGSGVFTKQEINEIVQVGYLNGLFVLTRSIGLIGYRFEQKRWKAATVLPLLGRCLVQY